MIWTIKHFADESGNDLINQDLQLVRQNVRAKYYERLSAFRDRPQYLWNGKRSKALTGWDGLFEIRFEKNNIQYRQIGFFGPNQNDFTVLLWATEKGGKFVPKNAPQLADDRRKLVTNDPMRAYACDF